MPEEIDTDAYFDGGKDATDGLADDEAEDEEDAEDAYWDMKTDEARDEEFE